MVQQISPGISKADAVANVADMLVRDYPGKFVRAQEQGTTERPKRETPRATEPAETEPEPEDTDVPEPASPDQDVADSSPEAEEQPEAVSDKEHNFAQLRQQLAEEKTRRESLERELRTERQRQSKEKRSEVIDAVLSNGVKPEGFDNWPKDKQDAWNSGQSGLAQIREHLGELGVAEMRRVVLERQILGQVPGLNDDQLDSMSQILASSALSIQEALTVAQLRNPDLFPKPASAQPSGGVMPAGHRVQEPSRSGRRRAPEPKDKQLMEAIHSAPTKLGKKRAAAAFIRERVFR